MGRLRVASRVGRDVRATRSSFRDRSRSNSPSRCTQSTLRVIFNRLVSYRVYALLGATLLVLLCLTWPRAGDHLTARPKHIVDDLRNTEGWKGNDGSANNENSHRKNLEHTSASTPGLPTPSLARRVREEFVHLEQDLQRILKNRFSPSRDDLAQLLQTLPPKSQTLRFKVCNGFANQRLSIVYGVLLAQRLGRTPVLPVLLRDGIQRTDATVIAHGANKVPFEDVYDLTFFLYELAKAGIRILEPHEVPRPSAYTEVALSSVGANVSGALSTTYGHLQHLSIDCPLFKMTPGEMNQRQDEPVIWGVLDALRPASQVALYACLEAVSLYCQSPLVSFPYSLFVPCSHSSSIDICILQMTDGLPPYAYVDSMQRGIKHLGAVKGKAATKYNFLHLRLENDWVEHCKRWTSIPDGVVRDNCYNNTETIDVQLRLFAFSPDVPLYVASYWNDVEPERAKKVISRLVDAGYRVITSNDVFPEAMRNADREIKALVEYYVGFGASRFIGNSVSTFAALALLERRHRDLWAAYYNGGNIPVAPYLPVHKLPWVFTYNSWSGKYDYMLKAAVRSAAHFDSLKPYCIFDGNTSSLIGRWLVDNNVTLIRHVPSWREELLKKAESRMKDNVQHSHLYKNPDMLVSTFQRVDLPVVPILDQYTYVLYTDADVYFRRPIHLDDFGLPLPRSVSMSYEFYKMFPYNAGIIMANLPTMRRNYKAFLAMMLDNDDGLYYPNYGPADQGIINKFYEHDLRSQMLNQAFNTKPYNDFDPNSFLVHFHGPKPHEYLSFVETGKCDFYSVCEQGFLKSLCQYVQEWQVYIPEETNMMRLGDSCTWLTNPTIMAVFQKKTGLLAQNQAVPDDKRLEFTQKQRLALSISIITVTIICCTAACKRLVMQLACKRQEARVHFGKTIEEE
ncbi:hypothetical protein VOLCADRAFT_106875 [Volvox carteri f. nagariensis]|uniref:O-fucosyltransferase family protein n=1 Tax=Volvox carteri f. nagariensis TaxID=3068 RepID=D8UAD5_VOLCA|nr:uncharacterized protein VOLCADRAFT_106875 [Volvox carteri f. nagariensis]EFJ43295.1 hypothetical protein VOLCADRAFT_106875 [Volvox carteri f. nagariensis]|eukprot:XP_002955655.1 hypothetical protein VOLCADRAFT_106875 [Volvox carteri f. nagariensis]